MERGQVTYSGTPDDLEQRDLLHGAYFGQGSMRLVEADQLKGELDEDA
jgi:hypothetical protein